MIALRTFAGLVQALLILLLVALAPPDIHGRLDGPMLLQPASVLLDGSTVDADHGQDDNLALLTEPDRFDGDDGPGMFLLPAADDLLAPPALTGASCCIVQAPVETFHRPVGAPPTGPPHA